MPEIAYVNGEFLPLERATVRVEDRGFQFADGVYEVVRTYGGKPFATDEHLARLSRSLEALELKNPLAVEQWKSIIDEGIQRSGFAEAIVYLQITRGCAPRHRGIPKDVEPTIVMTVRQLGPPATKVRETGIAVITVPEFRWGRGDIKSIALLPSVLAYQMAKKAGANDAIFVGDDDVVNESNCRQRVCGHAGAIAHASEEHANFAGRHPRQTSGSSPRRRSGDCGGTDHQIRSLRRG